MFGFDGAINGLLNWTSANETNDANMQMARENIRNQREFAQNSIQWKVNDAKKAGIHPLMALGNNATSYTPVHADRVTPQMNIDTSGMMQAILNAENQSAQTDLLTSQKNYYNALTQEVKDKSKAMASQNSNQMQGLATGLPLNGGFVPKFNGSGKNAIVTKSAEDFTNLVKHYFDDGYTLFPRGVDTPQAIQQYLGEYATDGSLNIFSKIGQYFNSLTPSERAYLVTDLLKSAGPTMDFVDSRNKYNTTTAGDALLRFNLFLDNIIPFMKYLWR